MKYLFITIQFDIFCHKLIRTVSILSFLTLKFIPLELAVNTRQTLHQFILPQFKYICKFQFWRRFWWFVFVYSSINVLVVIVVGKFERRSFYLWLLCQDKCSSSLWFEASPKVRLTINQRTLTIAKDSGCVLCL